MCVLLVNISQWSNSMNWSFKEVDGSEYQPDWKYTGPKIPK